jgi:hypothetical protein
MLPRRLPASRSSTDASGNATVFSEPFSGRVLGIKVTRGTLTSGAVDVTATVDGTEGSPC